MYRYQPGDLILKSEPFVYVVGDQSRGKRCDHCLIRSKDLKRCTQCRSFSFCNRSCQKGAWNMHKNECLLLKNMSAVPSEFVLLMARAIFKLKHSKEDREAYEDAMSKRRTFSALMSHVDEIKSDRQATDMFCVSCYTLKMYLGEDQLPSIHHLLDIFGKLRVNGFGIYDEEVVAVGSGLYLGASILDHSCCPNAVSTFNGRTLLVRAVKPITDDSQVRISYIDQIQRTGQRQMELTRQYFFTCACEWCNGDQMESAMCEVCVPGCETETATLLSDLKRAIQTKAGDLEECFERCLSAFRSCGLGPYHVLRSQLQNFLFDAAEWLRRWEDVVELGLLSLPTLKFYLGEYHPSVGVLLLKIGKLLLYLERLEECRDILQQARKVLAVTHGTDRQIFATCLDLIQNASEPSQLVWKT